MIVKQFIHKNQFVIEEGNRKTFQSYDSTICEIEPIKEQDTNATEFVSIKIYPDWDYSQTTLKHFYKFLEEYAPSIHFNILNKAQNKKQAIEKLINEQYIELNKNIKYKITYIND